MSLTTYTYNFTSFPNGIIAKDALYDEVEQSNITIELQIIRNDLVNVYFDFKDALSSGEQSTLDTIVANHQGIPLTDTITVEQGNSGSLPWKIDITSGSLFSHTILTASIVNFPTTQSVKIDQSIVLPVSVSNLPNTQSVFIGNAISLLTSSQPVFITNPTLTQSIYLASGSSGFTSGSPLWITGSVLQINQPITQSVFIANSLTLTTSSQPVYITNPVLTQSITGTITSNQGTSGSFPWKTVLYSENYSPITNSNPLWITGSIFQINQPTTQSIKIDQSITLPVSISNQIITQSVFVANSIILATSSQPVYITNPVLTQSITGSVSMNGATFTNTGINVFITGGNALQVSASVSNFPITQSVKIDQSIILPISVSNFPITQSIFVANSLNLATSSQQVWINNLPLTQSVKVDQSIVLPVSLSNTPLITITNPVTTASISNLPITQSVFIANSLNLATSSQPVFITNSTLTQSVKIDQSITLPVSVSNLPITQSVFVANSLILATSSQQTWVNNLPTTQSVYLASGSSGFSTNSPLWVTGSVQSSAVFPNSLNVTILTSSITQSISGTVFVSNFPTTQSVFIANTLTLATSSQPVFITNPTLTQSIKIDQSIILPVSISNFPTTQSVFIGNSISLLTSSQRVWVDNLQTTQSIKIDQSITLPVSVSNFQLTQSVSQANVTAGTGSFTPISGVAIVGRDASGIARNFRVDNTGIQYTALTSPSGALAGLNAFVTTYGTLRVTNEPSSLFSDDFDTSTVDITDRWITGSQSGGTITITSSSLSMSIGTSANAGAFIQSQPSFPSVGLGFKVLGFAHQMETGSIINTHRFWGFATQSGTWNTTNSITHGVGFEQDPAGAFWASIYSSGVRIFSSSLIRPTDGATHRYAILSRADSAVWYQDGIEIPVASNNFPSLNSLTLPIRFHIINAAAGSATAPTSLTRAVGLGDSAPATISLSDGDFQWRKAKIDKNGSLQHKEHQPATFSALITSQSIGNGKSMFSIMNSTSGSGTVIKIKSVKVINNLASPAVTGIVAQFNFLRMTGHSGGTSITSQTFDTADTLNSVVTTLTNGTITGAASTPLIKYFWSSDEWVVGTADQESQDHAFQNTLNLYEAKLGVKPITLRSQEGLTINQITNSTIGAFDLEIIFTQE